MISVLRGNEVSAVDVALTGFRSARWLLLAFLILPIVRTDGYAESRSTRDAQNAEVPDGELAPAAAFNGRLPDLVFQQSLDTFAKRHHIRVWKLPSTYEVRQSGWPRRHTK